MNQMVRFAHPELLYGLGILPAVFLLILWSAVSRKRRLRRFGNPALLQQLIPEFGKRKRVLKHFLLLLALCLLVLGLAGPELGTRLETVKREGVDILIAIDVSNSMNAEDFPPSRLENAKQQISLLLNRLQNDRIGLIVFAGNSFLQLPLTTDYSAARLFLSAIDTNIVSVQGTAIGSAIRLAMKSFVQKDKKYRVLIVISDGENHEDDAVKAAREAGKEGIVIHTIGMGSVQGVPIPEYSNGMRTGFKKDRDGNVIITKLDEATLQEIASAAGGKYVRASAQRNELDILFKEIGGMEKKQLSARVFTNYDEKFQYPLAAALILLLIEFLVSERRSVWLRRWNFSRFASSSARIVFLLLMISGIAFAESDRSLVRNGNRLYEKKEYSDAEVSYRKALEKNKEITPGVFNLGDALYKQGRYAEAATQFGQLAEKYKTPDVRAQAYHNLGNSLLKEKKLEDSINAYKQSLRLNPGDHDTQYNLEYAKELLKQQKQEQKQQQKEEKNKKNENKSQQNQKSDEKKNQDQKQKEQEQKGKDQKNQNQENEDKKENPQQQRQPPEQQKPTDQISKQDADRILQALKDEEKNVQKKLQKKVPVKSAQAVKDW